MFSGILQFHSSPYPNAACLSKFSVRSIFRMKSSLSTLANPNFSPSTCTPYLLNTILVTSTLNYFIDMDLISKGESDFWSGTGCWMWSCTFYSTLQIHCVVKHILPQASDKSKKFVTRSNKCLTLDQPLRLWASIPSSINTYRRAALCPHQLVVKMK